MLMKKEKLNYVEFAARDLIQTKQFFREAFGWTFVDYGDEYTAFSDQKINGGFYKAELFSDNREGGALLIFYSSSIEATYERVLKCGGVIVKEIFDFPGGLRFHFSEPSGNVFAVWSERYQS
ncbi:VOC family protein [Vibrio sp. SCSIO 43140]|uniref:VOC family protein n=1 Tax=Vibrio sp. SCSIO 43140 TaxID=2819100 RepID=UPI002074DD3E|nr:VOC family protein [Vibrio sp. SCSIO 43140]USD61321.1 VOC family protein [Vibrio sp. SCSIO 43140]